MINYNSPTCHHRVILILFRGNIVSICGVRGDGAGNRTALDPKRAPGSPELDIGQARGLPLPKRIGSWEAGGLTAVVDRTREFWVHLGFYAVITQTAVLYAQATVSLRSMCNNIKYNLVSPNT